MRKTSWDVLLALFRLSLLLGRRENLIDIDIKGGERGCLPQKNIPGLFAEVRGLPSRSPLLLGWRENLINIDIAKVLSPPKEVRGPDYMFKTSQDVLLM
jgi:hypothetical protein